MTVLATGGAGFIGSNFIFFWMENHPEDRAVCLDKLTYREYYKKMYGGR